MFSKAGLDDYKFMSGVGSLKELQDQLMIPGSKVGAKNCLWANEFQIRTVCDVLSICCLILDMDTKDPSSKYIKVGQARERFIVLHRSGEHFSLVYKNGQEQKGVMGKEDLTKRAKDNWKIE